MKDRLECMKETLMCAVESQLCDLGEVDTAELGEAIDMIKDLEEALYYCTVTEAMSGEYSDRMYYDTNRRRMARRPTSKEIREHEYDYDWEENGDNDWAMNDVHHTDKDGKSYNSRRMYMEAKEMKKDKTTQLRELEKYMNELSQDVTEMIADATTEEKAYLEKKITALATKIGQMK